MEKALKKRKIALRKREERKKKGGRSKRGRNKGEIAKSGKSKKRSI